VWIVPRNDRPARREAVHTLAASICGAHRHPSHYPGDCNHSGELGNAELRGWPDGIGRDVTDPQNLTWVIPAEEGVDRHNSQRPAVVVAGGDPIAPTDVEALPADALVIAADSGLDAAIANGISVDLVVGDLDSASPQAIERARRAGVPIDQHPIDKDATDLELALAAAVGSGAVEILVLGGYGGRLDHLLANALLLVAPMLDGITVVWRVGRTTVAPARPGVAVELDGEPGDRVSLLPVGGSADGVTTEGLAWPLHEETLHVGSTRGVSNHIDTVPAKVLVERGTVLVIHEQGTT